MLCRVSTSHLTVVSTLFCCCVLFRNNCPALLWLLLFPKSRPCPGRFWPFLAVSRFCQMTPPTPPPVASWGSASRQSAKQAVYCLWCRECGAMSETLSAPYHCAAVRVPAAINLSDTPWFSSSCRQVKWGCGLDSGKGICAVFSRTYHVLGEPCHLPVLRTQQLYHNGERGDVLAQARWIPSSVALLPSWQGSPALRCSKPSAGTAEPMAASRCRTGAALLVPHWCSTGAALV